MATRQEWIDRAGSLKAAVDFEDRALSIGREFLPAHVVAVRDGKATPGPDYWAWLVRTFDDVENESSGGGFA